MKLYCYDADTKCYTGTEEACLNPAETEKTGKNVYCFSANSTDVSIPIYGSYEIPQFNETTKSWSLVTDYRGQIVINISTKEILKYNLLGSLPENYTNILPSDLTQLPYLKFDITTQSWIEDLDILKNYARQQRDILLGQSDSKVIRNTSEKLLVEKGLLSKTTNTDEEMLEWETYRQQLREWMDNWTKGKVLPTTPDIA